MKGNGIGIFGDRVVVRTVIAQDNGVSGISGSRIDDGLEKLQSDLGAA